MLLPPAAEEEEEGLRDLGFRRVDLVFWLNWKRRIQPRSMTAKHSVQARSLAFFPTASRWCLCFRIPSLAHGAPASSRLSSSMRGATRRVSSAVSLTASSRMMAWLRALAKPMDCW